MYYVEISLQDGETIKECVSKDFFENEAQAQAAFDKSAADLFAELNHVYLANAITYVKRYVRNGSTRVAAEACARSLYDLDAEAMTLLKQTLDEDGVQ